MLSLNTANRVHHHDCLYSFLRVSVTSVGHITLSSALAALIVFVIYKRPGPWSRSLLQKPTTKDFFVRLRRGCPSASLIDHLIPNWECCLALPYLTAITNYMSRLPSCQCSSLLIVIARLENELSCARPPHGACSAPFRPSICESTSSKRID